MAEHVGLMQVRDNTGASHITYPITKIEAVDGLEETLAKLDPVAATSTDGATYTATVDGITSLYVGLKLTIVPDKASTSVSPKLNLNGLGDKYIRQPLSTNTGATVTGPADNWIIANKSLDIVYDGVYWKVTNFPRTAATGLYGIVPVENGGTGNSSVDTAPVNGSSKMVTSGGVHTALAGKLDKTTYEWSKEIAFGSTGKLCIGKFPMYDSNITVDISATTSTTYHGTLVIATQNINTSGGGSLVATVYGDAANTIAPNIYIGYQSGSNVISVYFSPQSWSKNLIHIQCVALAGAPTDICTSVDAVPSTATRKPVNALTNLGIDSKCRFLISSTQPADLTPSDIWFNTGTV